MAKDFFPLLVVAEVGKRFLPSPKREGAKSISTAQRGAFFSFVPVKDEGAEKFKMVLIRHC